MSVTRRRLLGGAALTALGAAAAGCTGSPARRPASAPAGPAEALLAAAREEAQLIATYELALTRYPAQAAVLGAVLAEHRAHAAALPRLSASGPTPLTSTTAAASPAAPAPSTTPSTASPAALPTGPTAGLAALVALEQAASARRQAGSLTVRGRSASLLAALAASEAVHAVALTSA